MTEQRATTGRNTHPLHSGERIWRESNCYVDLWIGLLHHLQLDPVAMLACAAAPRFEGDQWTFCKPTASELATLYGIRVEELQIWGGMGEHVARQVERGRIVLVEVDGFFLPDTHGVTYRVEHHKTTIGIHRLDEATGTLSYFHNAGMYTLDGADLEGVFATTVGGSVLPPFAELADPSRATIVEPRLLRARSIELAAARLALLPDENPFLNWALVAEAEVDALANNALCYFHAWAFATVRQAGSMAELLAAWCEWASDDPDVALGSAALRELAQTLAAQQFRLARLPSGGRRPDFADALRRCAALWQTAQRGIVRIVEEHGSARTVAPPATATTPAAFDIARGGAAGRMPAR